MKYSFDKIDGREFAMTAESQKSLLNLLTGLPHGVVAMHPEMAGLVETSTNLAIIRCEKKQAEVICNTRSSITSALQATRDVLKAVSDLAGAKIALQNGYPGWLPNLQSPLLAKLQEVHRSVAGKDAEVNAVHAGLECGIIGEKYPGMDMISFGPTIEHPHSPDRARPRRFRRKVLDVLDGRPCRPCLNFRIAVAPSRIVAILVRIPDVAELDVAPFRSLIFPFFSSRISGDNITMDNQNNKTLRPWIGALVILLFVGFSGCKKKNAEFSHQSCAAGR